MTTLRTFQDEIEQIQQRELAKQRAAGQVTLEREKERKGKPAPAEKTSGQDLTDVQRLAAKVALEREREKKVKTTPAEKTIDRDVKDVKKAFEKTPGKDQKGGKKGVADASGKVDTETADKSEDMLDTDEDMIVNEEELEVRLPKATTSFISLTSCVSCVKKLLLSGVRTNHDRARDYIAFLLTRGRGEFIFRIGARPQHVKLFTGDTITAADSAGGTVRTAEELDVLKAAINEVVDEIGGKVSSIYRIS